MVVFGQSGCIWAKIVVLGQSGSIRAILVVFEQSGWIWARVVVFGQSCVIRAKWLHLWKSGSLRQKGFIRSTFGKGVCVRSKVVALGESGCI